MSGDEDLDFGESGVVRLRMTLQSDGQMVVTLQLGIGGMALGLQRHVT